MRFMQVGNLIRTRAVRSYDIQQISSYKHDGEHTSNIHIAQLRNNNGKKREQHSPRDKANRVPQIITAR